MWCARKSRQNRRVNRKLTQPGGGRMAGIGPIGRIGLMGISLHKQRSNLAPTAMHKQRCHRGGEGVHRDCGQPRTASGVRGWGQPSPVPACRRHPGRRNTGLRTAATPRGVAKMSASGHHLHIVHITASRYRVPPPSQLRLAPRRATLHRAAPHHHAPPLAPRSAARASPCRTAPPRHLTMRYRVPHCTTRRQLSPPPAELHCNAV